MLIGLLIVLRARLGFISSYTVHQLAAMRPQHKRLGFLPNVKTQTEFFGLYQRNRNRNVIENLDGGKQDKSLLRAGPAPRF